MELQSLGACLKLPNPPRTTVLALCRSLGRIPPEYRGEVYQILLNVEEEAVSQSLNNVISGPSHDTISVDSGGSSSLLPSAPVSPQNLPSQTHQGLPQIHMDDDLSRLSIDDFDDEMSVASSAASYTSESVPLPSPLKSVPPPLPNQRVIKADAERTRGDPKTIERLLTHYCISNDIKYKQGLNELLAPFLTLTYSPACNDPELVAFGCFTAFTKKFLPTNVYADDGHTALQCCFRFFRVLLLYHSPNVCKLLDGHRLPPELYASGWFLTLFAQRLEMVDLFSFWDLYVLYDEPVLHHFVCLRLLMRGESTIAAASGEEAG